MALTLPIEAVGSAASLIFLLTFALVNLSVIVLRRKAPEIERRYRVPFYPVTPILGIVLNVFLALYQFSFQPIAWYVTVGWIVLGLLLYYGYFQKKAAGAEPQVLVPGRPDEVAGRAVRSSSRSTTRTTSTPCSTSRRRSPRPAVGGWW